MDYQIIIQGTPNPNALKFVLNTTVKTQGNAVYQKAEACGENALAKALFTIGNVAEVYFFDNFITVTQDGRADWNELEDQIHKVILENIPDHNPDFQTGPAPVTHPANTNDNPDLQKISQILDETVRPALQMDGGDLQLVDYRDNVLVINYQGACGSCPSAQMGTLKAIENLLRDSFNPNITVESM